MEQTTNSRITTAHTRISVARLRYSRTVSSEGVAALWERVVLVIRGGFRPMVSPRAGQELCSLFA